METGPMTRGEKLMYNVLSRANLVQYYHAFIAQGGDDVYQLCESGEDEFLEIMALVGMASKPLHVRRLQKTLQEFLTNPDLFKENNNKDIYHHRAPIKTIESLATSNGSRQTGSPNQKQNRQPPPPQQHILQTWEDSPVANSSFVSSQSNSYLADSPNSEGFGVGGFNFKMEGMPVTWTCRLNDEQRTNIEQMTAEFAKDLPMYAPKPLNMKKPVDKEIEDVLNIPEDDPTRMDLIRKYSAIYGRFDSKRKVEKQMNFHEMCVNEAAAQLCKHRPSLLTRREDLFSLSRKIVRECGYQISRAPSVSKLAEAGSSNGDGNDESNEAPMEMNHSPIESKTELEVV